jgi:hypothetical protein
VATWDHHRDLIGLGEDQRAAIYRATAEQPPPLRDLFLATVTDGLSTHNYISDA